MHKTRLTFFYLAGYLIPTGLGLMFAPRFTLKMLFSNGHYDDVFTSFTGVMMVALGFLVVRMIWVRAEAMYPATLAVRSILWPWMLVLYLRTGDPFFLVVLVVLGLGMALTATFYLLERRPAASRV